QFSVQPGELSDDFQFRLCALPHPALAVTAVQKETAERGEFGPTNINVRCDLVLACRCCELSTCWTAGSCLRLPVPEQCRGGPSDVIRIAAAMVSGDVAADDAVTQPGAVEDITHGALDTSLLVIPSVAIIAHPGHCRSVQRRKSFRMAPRLILRP